MNYGTPPDKTIDLSSLCKAHRLINLQIIMMQGTPPDTSTDYLSRWKAAYQSTDYYDSGHTAWSIYWKFRMQGTPPDRSTDDQLQGTPPDKSTD